MAIDWVKLELNTAGFDPAVFAAECDQALGSGIVLTTLADLGNSEANQRRLYELNAECSADIPERGPFHTWPDYQRLRLAVPSFDPAGAIIALDNDRWVGMSVTSDHSPRGYAFQEMTGVVRSHRRRHIALAMKVTGVAFVNGLGVSRVCTIHHPANEGMIALNRRLGYVDATWDWPS